jgi:hypothetical protein
MGYSSEWQELQVPDKAHKKDRLTNAPPKDNYTIAIKRVNEDFPKKYKKTPLLGVFC